MTRRPSTSYKASGIATHCPPLHPFGQAILRRSEARRLAPRATGPAFEEPNAASACPARQLVGAMEAICWGDAPCASVEEPASEIRRPSPCHLAMPPRGVCVAERYGAVRKGRPPRKDRQDFRLARAHPLPRQCARSGLRVPRDSGSGRPRRRRSFPRPGCRRRSSRGRQAGLESPSHPGCAPGPILQRARQGRGPKPGGST